VGLVLCVSVVSSEWLQIPGRRHVHHTCAHEVPEGSHVVDLPENDFILVQHKGEENRLPRCQHPYSEYVKEQKQKRTNLQDWQVWTQYDQTYNKTFTAMTNYFTTPTTPPSWSTIPGVGIIYIFPGLQNDDWVPLPNTPDAPPGFDIIQPVLQYGSGSANGGGKKWECANWYVTLDDGALFTPATNVNDGDLIFGNMTQLADPKTWYIGFILERTGEVNGFTVTKPRLSVQNWAFVTLEIYNVFDCDHLPQNSESAFTDIVLLDNVGQSETPKWDAFEGAGNQCNTKIDVVDPTAVNIIFP